jgi:hypothetical protein
MAGGADQDIFIIKCCLEVTNSEICKEPRRAIPQAAKLRRLCDLLSLRRQNLERRSHQRMGKANHSGFF